MKVNRLVGLAVVLIAFAALTNTTAFKTASVTNNTSIQVVTTQSAGLALSAASSQDSGIVPSFTGGQMTLTFADKLQPGSTYCFSPAFTITNTQNAGQTVGILTLDAPVITGMPGTATMTLYRSGGSSCATTFLNSTIAAAGSADIDLQIVVPAGTSLATSTPAIQINAHR